MAGRPKLDPNARRLNVQLAPPADLSRERAKLWHREFDRFPPGYYVPADMRALLLYLDAVEMYDRARAALDKAEAAGGEVDAGFYINAREAMKMVHRLQRDLRMYPVTRTHREIHGSLANDPKTQTTAPGGQEAGWRALFAVPNGSDKPTPKKR